jgi:pimeloyl-ACP methyl ester carboxylesterase
MTYTTGAVTSADGTTIGYRQIGRGPSLVLIHGGLQAAQSFMKLATALSDAFTVVIPDRRGRGRSGPFGRAHDIDKEVEDVRALLDRTDAHDVFGLSSGAVIALRSALDLPEIHRLAVYEPPRAFPEATAWVPRYEREITRGELASAFVTAAKGTGDATLFRFLPRFLMVPLLRLAMRAQAKAVKDGDVPMNELIPTLHYDARIVSDAEGALESFRALRCRVLLMGGTRSARYLTSRSIAWPKSSPGRGAWSSAASVTWRRTTGASRSASPSSCVASSRRTGRNEAPANAAEARRKAEESDPTPQGAHRFRGGPPATGVYLPDYLVQDQGGGITSYLCSPRLGTEIARALSRRP